MSSKSPRQFREFEAKAAHRKRLSEKTLRFFSFAKREAIIEARFLMPRIAPPMAIALETVVKQLTDSGIIAPESWKTSSRPREPRKTAKNCCGNFSSRTF